MRSFLVSAALAAWFVAPAAAVSPHNSINPEKPKPTPYGLDIVRSAEKAQTEAPLRPVEVSPDRQSRDLASSFGGLVEAFERQGGPYDLRLAEPLHGMGKALMESGEPLAAMRVFRRAMQVSRINEGLNAPTQLPIYGDMIQLRLLLGQFDQADELVERRFSVQQAVYAQGSDEWHSATREYIDWQRQAYLQGVGGESYLRLLNMHDLHSDNIEWLQQQGGNDAELIQQLNDRMLVEYLISRYDGERQSMLRIQLSGPGDPDPLMSGQLEGERFRQLQKNNFRNGRRALEAIIAATERSEGPESESVAEAYVALGDWYMWWQEESRALQHYRKAWELLAANAGSGAQGNTFFDRPVELPDTRVFLSDGSVPTENAQAKARVMFTVSRLGEARDIEILEQEPPEDMGARVVLHRLLRDVRFRPVIRDGEAVAWTGLRRDYSYQY
ncbi:hypothetical protein DWB85_09500 [Seongchinamella sediminis]|uniref:Tetratricopeptide repeat protein n=1 Tax=Seongchinamella sediminis TaxID=2283635 RepID=A0A3L7DX74_9GAMM|nr:hypothetical protein [Seongchinamella sediminis]RLQ22158.1 hypothetical protein DWB85_09500 [Seongchinamella sediminis]